MQRLRRHRSPFRRSSALPALLLLIIAVLPSDAQQRHYFYKGLGYGSESVINPGSLILNAGFDILQSATHSRRLADIRLADGFTNVWRNLRDPFTPVRKFGVGRFIGQEVFPTSLSLEKAQWFPNYTLHFLGGGMDARMMYEWYDAHAMPYPAALAGLTVAAYHLVNEASEHYGYDGPNVDPVADIYLFNIGGALLFTSDAVAEFFSGTLNMTAWPGQPAWNPQYGTLENHGQYYIMKYRLPWGERTSLFYHFGDNGMLGVSYRHNDDESVTMSAGFAARELRTVDVTNGARSVTVSLGWIAGLFYDRNNSVLASVMASNRVNEKVRVNVYPGMVRLFGSTTGFFAGLGRDDRLVAGISFSWLPFGFALRNSPPPPPSL